MLGQALTGAGTSGAGSRTVGSARTDLPLAMLEEKDAAGIAVTKSSTELEPPLRPDRVLGLFRFWLSGHKIRLHQASTPYPHRLNGKY